MRNGLPDRRRCSLTLTATRAMPPGSRRVDLGIQHLSERLVGPDREAYRAARDTLCVKIPTAVSAPGRSVAREGAGIRNDIASPTVVVGVLTPLRDG